MSIFRPIHSTVQIWTDFHENEAKKICFFEEKKFKMADFSRWPFFQNGRFSKSPVLEVPPPLHIVTTAVQTENSYLKIRQSYISQEQ